MPRPPLSFLGLQPTHPCHDFCLAPRVLRKTLELTQTWGQRPPCLLPLCLGIFKASLVSPTMSAGVGSEPGALLTNLWYLSNLLCLSWCHQVSRQCPRALGNKLKPVQRYLDHLCDCWAGEMEV